MAKEGEVFLLVLSERLLTFGKRGEVSCVAFRYLIEYRPKLLLQIGRYIITDFFPDGTIQLRELPIGPHDLFLRSLAKLSAFGKVSYMGYPLLSR